MSRPYAPEPLRHLALRVEQDIFLVRQRGREVAAAVGLEHQDQVRLATALSEVARDLLRAVDGADVTFTVDVDAAGGWPVRFLANVSHELRAPVTAIIGLARLLADSASDPLTGEQARQVGLIRSSASDLLTLVNELLDLAKAESGRIEPVWAEVDLRGIFGQLRGTLRAVGTRPEVELVVEEPPAPATGLPYARRLVTLLGGRLDLTSEPGRGSTFTVVLPQAGA